ncbi:hypothetical protein EV702DRAFT_1181131 [Suillus placidus]|uniref:Nuclear pore complex protein n=1 Tax=Suillus placidus TaxID=48579 RepID=A0A9P6ZQ59_9AGAM|nr:hypothetical protein EV702DRAFT_1181131 [Suillus placidus]
MSEGPYIESSCTEVLSVSDYLAAVLDLKAGFAPRLRQLCRDQCVSNVLSRQGTARLLTSPKRNSTSDARRPIRGAFYSCNAASERQSIMHSSVLLAELVVVREWLHETAPQPQHPTNWKFTKHNVMQPLRTGLGIREGLIDEAVELCRKAHQPWRTASIRCSLLFQWRIIGKSSSRYHPRASDLMTANEQRDADAQDGKETHPNLPDPERILYVALAPCPQTFSVLKSACRTWEDHLWAQISIVCEEKQTAEMMKLGGGFWDGGLAVLENMPSPPSQEEDAAGSDIYVGNTRYPTMTRFFAHLCLYLRMIDMPVRSLATQVILEAYLQVLEAAGQRELIAMYVGALGDNAVERYAMSLTSLELTADVNERRLALTRAVAVVTAERTIDRAFEGTPSDVEFLLLPTVILWHFLGAGRVSLAKNLVEMLPRELASIDQPEERATEYLHYRQFFSIWDDLDRVVECQTLEVRQIFVPELILRLHVMLYASREHVPENLKRALELANIVVDSMYKLLGEYLDAVRRATIAGLEGGGSDPFKIIPS